MSSMTVRAADTSVIRGINDLPVASFSTLIDLAESACTAILVEHFQVGETSYTSQLSVSFLSGAAVGSSIRAHATCIESSGDHLSFSVEIHHESRLVATVNVERRIVERVSFMARTAAEGILSSKKEEKNALES